MTKRRRVSKPKPIPAIPLEGAPTPERLARAGRDGFETFVPSQSEHYRTVRMLDGSPLEKLASKGLISGDQYNAGVRFYGDWYKSGLAASGTIDPATVIVDGMQRHGDTDARLTALTRWQRAIQAVGKLHSHALISLLLNEEPFADYGKRRFGSHSVKLAGLSARISLINALDELDLHYAGKRKRPGIRTTHGDDYRPSIQPLDKTGTDV